MAWIALLFLSPCQGWAAGSNWKWELEVNREQLSAAAAAAAGPEILTTNPVQFPAAGAVACCHQECLRRSPHLLLFTKQLNSDLRDFIIFNGIGIKRIN